MVKPNKPIIILLMLCFCIFPVMVAAAADENVDIPAGTFVAGSTFQHGGKIRIDGTIDGDLYVAGQDIWINGTVNGDVLGAGQNLTITGRVEGDIRVAGQNIRLQGPVDGSATVAGQNIYVEKSAQVGRDLVTAGASTRINGKVGRNIYGAMEEIQISNSIGGNVRLFGVNTVQLLDGTVINGDIVYDSPKKADIKTGAVIAGKETWNQTKTDPVNINNQYNPLSSTFGFVISLVGLLLVWLVGKLVHPEVWSTLAKPLKKTPGVSIGLGVLILLAAPVICIILMFTVVGIPLAIISLLLYGVLLYMSKLIVAQYMIELTAARFNYTKHEFWLLLPAVVLLMLATRIPYIGWIISLTIISTGLGSTFKAMIDRSGSDKTDTPVE